MNCRHCAQSLEHTFIDLGFAPPSNAYISAEDLNRPELYFPLRVKVCQHCWLVQTEDYAAADQLFSSEYAYFSSTSTSWLAHAKKYSGQIIPELQLNSQSFVVEVAANDGYLLKNFVSVGIPCLGIEPTDSTATAAEQLDIPVLREFFGAELGAKLAKEGKSADLIIGNNVYAHVPDINDFTKGLKNLLKRGGTITLEFPHLMRLLEFTQFDTIYHEHFSYLSLYTVNQIFAAQELRIYKVEELPTHGGSLRIFGCHATDVIPTDPSVATILAEEAKRGIQKMETYTGFQQKAEKIKDDLLSFLINQKQKGKKVVGYGAAAKGNTLLNFAGIKPDLLPEVYDAAKAKQGKYLPGSHIPILSPDHIQQSGADFVLILPWNISDEVMRQYAHLSDAGVKFVSAVPTMKLYA